MSYNIFYKTSSYYYIMASSMSTLVETAGVSKELTLEAPPAPDRKWLLVLAGLILALILLRRK